MSEVNYFSNRMTKMSDDELKNYVENNVDFQEYAVLAAISELEKRGVIIEKSNTLKQELTAKNTPVKALNTEKTNNTTSNNPTLYSTEFILIFGVFTLLGGSILMALNFLQLKNLKAARLVVISALVYSFLTAIILQSFGVVNPLISLAISILGIYLLYHFIYKKEFPESIKNFTPRNIWIPIFIALLVSLPLAYLLLTTGALQ